MWWTAPAPGIEVFEGIAARAKAGNANSESAEVTGRLAASFARRAAELI
jgi:hypothetical protein